MAQKRPFNEGKRHFKKNKKQKPSGVEGSSEDVLLADIRQLLKDTKLSAPNEGSVDERPPLPEPQTEIELTIATLSSTGDGLAHRHGHVYVVPFAAPGDTVTAKVYKHIPEASYTLTDFLAVSTPGPHRTETPRCPYFTQCSGCQFQHLPYAYQLAHKRRVVEKAYANFSHLPAAAVPAVGETIGSPLQYAYRTKLTPHFDEPPGGRRDRRHGKEVTWPGVPPIGFMRKGGKKTMDIEECPIGTEAVQRGLVRERARVGREIGGFQRGATLLLRESTERIAKGGVGGEVGVPGVGEDGDGDGEEVVEDRGEYVDRKTCITDPKATSTEYVDAFRFDNPAGAFFQNNNGILPLVTRYIREHILGPPTTSTPSTTTSSQQPPKIKNLIDAYCGSGFFTVALSATFSHSIGIDIAAPSIASARHNAALNHLPADSTTFLASDANALFAAISSSFLPEETAVIIDPPRKGCDEGFIRQLLRFAPARVCYVSCNVHTQARDVGWLVGGLVGGSGEGEGLPVEGGYEIESLRGLDFFPQTGHVEGVAILRRKRVGEGQGDGDGQAGEGVGEPGPPVAEDGGAGEVAGNGSAPAVEQADATPVEVAR
ncbi:tRNA(m5U54)methyltransferase [Teratosphaeriaceae sp. CCFEE 6253]|nr:tRNA(m5U54)methyltransferase [Teratosphaeriaceae sp. CCFEE 6253]